MLFLQNQNGGEFMSKGKFKLFFIFLLVGFICLALDINVKTNINYPHQYANSNNVIGEFQFYNIASNYGAKCTYKLIDTSSSTDDTMQSSDLPSNTQKTAGLSQTKVIDKVFFDNVRIDIFNDLLGFLLIALACLGLRKCGKEFSFATASAFCGMLLHIILKSLPFVFNGLSLCNISMVLGIAYIGSIILTTFLFSKGFFRMCSDICCRDERKWGKITWFVTMVLQILLAFVFWVGSDFGALKSLGYIIEGFLVLDIVIFWLILKRVYYYLEKSYINANSDRK